MADKALIKEVKSRLRNKQSPAQIKQDLTSKGVKLNDINAAIYAVSHKKPRKIKKAIYIAAIIAAIVVVGLLLYFLLKPEPQPYYQDDPKTWIDDQPNGVKEINVDKVTKGEGFVDAIGEQYRKGDIATVFAYEGFYQGNYFKREYVDETTGKVLMRINQDMKPNDGIIEGFIVEKIEDDGKIYAYIFVDEDWKKNLPDTQIYWGKSYQNTQEYVFNNVVSQGIYLMKVEDDTLRFENNFALSQGGIYVGELKEDETSTLMSFS